MGPFLRAWGYDPGLFRAQEGLSLVRWTHATAKYEPLLRVPGYNAAWRQNTDPAFYCAFEHMQKRCVMIMHHWDENTYIAPGAEEVETRGKSSWRLFRDDGTEWPLPFNRGRLHAQANGDLAREPFTHALVKTDPEQITFGFVDVNLHVGNEQPLRSFARVFTALPSKRSTRVLHTGLSTNLAIREWKDNDKHIFLLANPCPWEIEGQVALMPKVEARDIVSLKKMPTTFDGRHTTLPVQLEPYGLIAFQVMPRSARVVSWQAAKIPRTSAE